MLCQECNQKEANVHVTQIINGYKKEQYLCQDCAQKSGGIGIEGFIMSDPLGFNVANFLDEIIGTPAKPQKSIETGNCSGCSMTLDEFSHIGKFGCKQCYNTFSLRLRPLLKKIHGNLQHTGKLPRLAAGEIQVRREKDKLKLELRKAIETEEYEKAAEIRDKIREFEK